MTTKAEQQELTKQELAARINLIETMIAEGRQSTESWGWTFVLWGVAYYVAIAWAYWGNTSIAWPVTMVTAGLITALIALRRRGDGRPGTNLGRSMISVWISLGISLFLFGICSGLSGHGDQNVVVAVIATMLGMANATSSLTLRWRPQFACAVVWWAAAVLSLFGTVTQSSIGFLVAIFLCQIVFGSYMMISEARERKGGERTSGAAHA
ncbi:hypothetical protein [Acidicapsa acidisoli]|uniref:hypothetical protein n=1 Tax=Acidicapsa acidisoli TaxID=1615681 RepID=UPI0021E0D05E|nr:hypothetical protein [Acidicapsa acidisoli]